jgi:pimeloyl-ACP methyl ester carboxylesterase
MVSEATKTNYVCHDADVEKAARMRPVRGYVDTPEGQVHFRRCGTGRPVILLHQAPGSSSMWTALLPELAALGWQAIAFDLPGYGMSDPPQEQPDLAYYSRRIEEAALGLGLDRFDLIGHHTGSCVALWLATSPSQRVRRMIGYGLAVLDEPLKRELADEADPDYEAGGREVLSWWKSFTSHVPPGQAPVLVPRYTADMLLSAANRAYGHRAVGRANLAPRIEALNIPVLAVAGRNELLYEGTRRLAEASAHIEFHEFGDAGIFAADEHPAQLALLFHEFLSKPES